MEKIKNFVENWKNHGYEKGETQKFWLAFLRDVLNVDKPENFIDFEVPVKLKHQSFIFFPTQKLLSNKNLRPSIFRKKKISRTEKF